MSRENVDIVRAALDAFERGEVERALAMADPQLVSTRVDPDGAVFHGHAGFLRMLDEWVEGFADLSFSGDEFIDAGDRVIVRLRQSARGTASGVPVEGEFWLVYTLTAGMIRRLDIYSDRRQALEAAEMPGYGGSPAARRA
jgi:ketosteroid isomerase-like protein